MFCILHPQLLLVNAFKRHIWLPMVIIILNREHKQFTVPVASSNKCMAIGDQWYIIYQTYVTVRTSLKFQMMKKKINTDGT
jgi:hypothetical protein